ncbi:cyclin-like protein interacting with PHO85 [Coemansia sp. RSA 1822]|nr:cyclin-like protein interacting with PHO85 [Coemansia sp. RSA 638]KAJ2123597.1 cyclin-like protein interacting with PHO85 [Coemansia sp. RSA 720]KAJ2474196.1 cyclin-like protein interacting with PHO85 [Coemansia sp. RSA 2131]KAJ2543585.1 cyclin-like protein interacting with PHO85 [Coemansia sp. RSA 1853]KAJ2558331.1 cyclin-like protein interacting with PHO85 [Coemansia sp. RSA 1822]
MAFNLASTPVLETVRFVSAYLDNATGCSRALELQALDPSAHERQTSLTLFHARSVPTIDLETYISRILKYCPCQNEVFLALIVYMQQLIDRCGRRRAPFTVDAYSIHRLVITAVTIGSKWFSDVFFTNSRYAKVGGLSVAELNNLELQFLSIIDFDLNVRPETLQAMGTDLFANRLPTLSNAHFDSMHDPAPYMSVHAHPPASARYPSQYPHVHYPPAQPQRVYEPQYVYEPQSVSRQQKALRHVSYPGPNGAYYSYNNVYKYPEQTAYKQAHVYNPSAYVVDPASGSTLASSPPPDSMPVSALHQNAV